MRTVFGISNTQLRLRVAIAMTVSGFVAVFGWQLAATHYSNACDPGLERFKLDEIVDQRTGIFQGGSV